MTICLSWSVHGSGVRDARAGPGGSRRGGARGRGSSRRPVCPGPSRLPGHVCHQPGPRLRQPAQHRAPARPHQPSSFSHWWVTAATTTAAGERPVQLRSETCDRVWPVWCERDRDSVTVQSVRSSSHNSYCEYILLQRLATLMMMMASPPLPGNQETNWCFQSQSPPCFETSRGWSFRKNYINTTSRWDEVASCTLNLSKVHSF